MLSKWFEIAHTDVQTQKNGTYSEHPTHLDDFHPNIWRHMTPNNTGKLFQKPLVIFVNMETYGLLHVKTSLNDRFKKN